MKRPLLERDIEKRLVQRAKELGGEVRKVKWIGRSGAPDRLVMRNADQEAAELLYWARVDDMKPSEIVALARKVVGLYLMWPELKAPGVPAKAHQLREHARMRKMGQRVEVIDSYEQIEELLK